MPSSFNLFRACVNSSELLTVPPNLLANLLFSLESSKNTCLRLVPAIEPLIPALARVPSTAVVSSKENPATLATGATNDIELVNLSMSRAVEAKLVAITSVILTVSLASKPKALNVEPATLADCDKSRPNAVARFNVPSVTSKISSEVNPSLLNSICKFATSEAVNFVEPPNLSADCSSCFNFPPVAPAITDKFLIFCSNSAPTLVAPLKASTSLPAPIKATVTSPAFFAKSVNDESTFLVFSSAPFAP